LLCGTLSSSVSDRIHVQPIQIAQTEEEEMAILLMAKNRREYIESSIVVLAGETSTIVKS
jgi:hypothetical protein